MASVQHDRAFRRKLIETIKLGDIPSAMSETLSEEANQKVIKWDRLREFLFELNRVVMCLMCDFCRIDIMKKFELQPNKWARLKALLRSTNLNLSWKLDSKFNSNPRSSKLKRWPRVLLWIFIVSATVSSINAYFSYSYHANLVKLRALDKLEAATATASRPNRLARLGNLSELRQSFELEAQKALDKLELIGANHLNWTFVYESIVLLFVPTAIISYLIIPILCTLGHWLLLAPGALMNRRAECEAHAELVLVELKRFSLLGDQMQHHPARLMTISSRRFERHRSPPDSLIRFYLQEVNQETVELLKRIALEGRLNPLGRTLAARDRQTLLFTSCLLFMLLFMQSSLIVAYLILSNILDGHHEDKNNKRVEHLMDRLDTLNLIFIGEICANVALVYMLMLALTIYEQFQSVTSLRVLILDLIARNQTKAQLNPVELKLNLLTVILQNRIIVKSFALAKKPLNVIAFLLIFFCTLQPLIFKLHSAYFVAQVRWVSSAWGLMAVGCSLAFVYLLGLLHQAYIRTFHCLWSLVAQLSALEQVGGPLIMLALSKSAALATIRRELSDQRQATDKFACRLLSIPITNTNIIKIAFYLLLVLFSLSSDYKVLGNGVTRFLSDPFGLYNFLEGR